MGPILTLLFLLIGMAGSYLVAVLGQGVDHGQFIANVPKRVYANRRFFPVDGGFVQQHDTKLHFADGRVLVLPVCIVFKVVDGKIARLDEYLDRATLDRWAKGGG